MPPNLIQQPKLRIKTFFDDKEISIDQCTTFYEKVVEPDSKYYKLLFEIRSFRSPPYPLRFINKVKFQYAIRDRRSFRFITLFQKDIAVLAYDRSREINISWYLHDDNNISGDEFKFITSDNVMNLKCSFICKLKNKLINDCERLLSDA